jgi:hypothetical protein
VSGLSLIPTDTGAQPEITFTWTVPPPSATTTAATALTSSSATLHGTVNPNASPLTDCHFVISPAPPGGSTISCAQQLGAGTLPVPVSAQLQGLRPSTRYTASLLAANAQGPSLGSAVTFTTLPPAPRISALTVPATVHKHRRRHARPAAISLRVSQAATLQFSFDRLARRRPARRLALTWSIRAHAGSNTVAFSTRGLGVGRYRLTLVATNAVGERSAAYRATFRVVR